MLWEDLGTSQFLAESNPPVSCWLDMALLAHLTAADRRPERNSSLAWRTKREVTEMGAQARIPRPSGPLRTDLEPLYFEGRFFSSFSFFLFFFENVNPANEKVIQQGVRVNNWVEDLQEKRKTMHPENEHGPLLQSTSTEKSEVVASMELC